MHPRGLKDRVKRTIGTVSDSEVIEMDFVVAAIDEDLHRDAASPGVAVRDHERDILPCREG